MHYKYDSKYDKNFINRLVQSLNWHRSQIQIEDNKPTVIVWDLDSGEMRGALDITEEINTVSLTPDGSKALTCQKWEHTVTLWNLKDLSKITDIKPQYDYLSAIFSPDGEKFAVCWSYPDEGYLQIYNSEGKPLGDKLIIKNQISGLCWFFDNIRLLTYSNNMLAVVNSTNGEVLTKELPNLYYIHDACVSLDNSKIAIVDSDGIEVFISSDLSLERSLKLDSYAKSVTFNNSSDMVLFSCDGYTEEFFCNRYAVVIWDYANNTSVDRQFGGHTDSVNSLTCCRHGANGTLVFSGGDDRKVLLWDIKTGYVIKKLKGCSSGVTCIDISADCRTGISAQHESQYITGQIVRVALENNSRVITRRG